jgi:uncharacterized membrane protein
MLGRSIVDQNVIQLAKQLLESGFTDFSDREKRVITRIASRLHVARDLNRTIEERQTFADRVADRVALFGGSWTFIIIFIAAMIAWAVLNTLLLHYGMAFDVYPYIFLNLPTIDGRGSSGPCYPDVTEPPS